jgi:hypothetical protein
MQFKIKRASDILHEKPPCPEATLIRDDGFDKEYEVTLTSLEDLMAFIKRHGELVINSDSITIYDYYSE